MTPILMGGTKFTFAMAMTTFVEPLPIPQPDESSRQPAVVDPPQQLIDLASVGEAPSNRVNFAIQQPEVVGNDSPRSARANEASDDENIGELIFGVD